MQHHVSHPLQHSLSPHSFSLSPEQQTMLGALFQDTLYYRDINLFTHRRLDVLMFQLPLAPGAYVLLTLTYTAEREGQDPLNDQVSVMDVACQPCPAQKAFQILNAGEMTPVGQDSGKFAALLSIYRDYLSIGHTVRVEWWTEHHREEAGQ